MNDYVNGMGYSWRSIGRKCSFQNLHRVHRVSLVLVHVFLAVRLICGTRLALGCR